MTDGFTTYVGGYFTSVNGASRSGIAAFDPSGNLLPFNPRLNGSVNDMELVNNKLYVSGGFTQVNGNVVQTGGIEIDNTNAINESFPQVNGSVISALPDGSGGWIVGGSFTTVGSSKRNNLARINSDGSVHPLSITINQTIYSMFLNGTTLYIGGDFTAVNGVTRRNIAAININDGSLITTFNPNGNGRVNAFALSGATLYVGGSFSNIGGLARTRIAALNTSDGTATTTFTLTANAVVNSLSLNGSTLYVSGAFTQISGTTRNSLAAINIGASPATLGTWNPNVNGQVMTLNQSGTTLYIGGTFTTVAGATTRNRLAAYDTTTPTAPTLKALNPNLNNIVYSTVVRGSYLYAAGSFTTSGGLTRKFISEIQLSDGSTTSFDLGVNGSLFINSLSVQGTRILVGGFGVNGFGNGVSRNGFAAFDVTTNTNNVTSFNPSPDSSVSYMESNGTTLFVHGNFSTISGSSRNSFAAFNLSNETLTGFNPGISSYPFVMIMKLDGNILYVGGYFTSLGGASRANFGAIDTTLDTNNATSLNPSPNNTVYGIEIKGSTIYLGGEFTTVGGATRQSLAAINKTTGLATAFNPNPDSYGIYSMGLVGSSLYVMGDFTTIGGQSREWFASVNTNLDTNNATRFDPVSVFLGDSVLKSTGDTLYVTGDFYGSSTHEGFAALKVCDP